MLSYRHGFHAGNFADVLKHGVLAWVLDYLNRKPKPYLFLETHAGAGSYDLTSAAAQRTGEYRAGIGRLWPAATLPPTAAAPLAPYLRAVSAANPEGVLARYPGSPAIAAGLLREGDRMHLAELHPTDHAALADGFAGQRRVQVVQQDGLALVKAALPPPERRGLVLIDPSYEVKDDYRAVAQALTGARRRWATGIYIVWYPLLPGAPAQALLGALADGEWLRAELETAPPAGDRGMYGCGLAVVNPPWGLAPALEALLPALARALALSGPGRWRLSVGD